MSIILTLRLPPPELSPNVRCHWAKKAKAVHLYRELAKIHAMAHRPRLPWKAATVRCRFYVKDKRRRDKDNFLASLKAAFDGIADAGIVADDSALTYLPIEIFVDKGNPRVEIELKEIEP